jgi:hypothetical protein
MPRSKNASKAKRAMVKTYGKKKGTQVYYATANKRGKGKSMAAKERSAFKSGKRK